MHKKLNAYIQNRIKYSLMQTNKLSVHTFRHLWIFNTDISCYSTLQVPCFDLKYDFHIISSELGGNSAISVSYFDSPFCILMFLFLLFLLSFWKMSFSTITKVFLQALKMYSYIHQSSTDEDEEEMRCLWENHCRTQHRAPLLQHPQRALQLQLWFHFTRRSLSNRVHCHTDAHFNTDTGSVSAKWWWFCILLYWPSKLLSWWCLYPFLFPV